MPIPFAMIGAQVGGMLLQKLLNRKSAAQKALERGLLEIAPDLTQASKQGLNVSTRLSKLAVPSVESGLNFYRDVLEQPDGMALQKLLGNQLGDIERAGQNQRNQLVEFSGRGGGRLEMNQQGEFAQMAQVLQLLGQTRAGAAGQLLQGGLGAQGAANDSQNAATSAANVLAGASGGAQMQQRMREQNGEELGQLGITIGKALGGLLQPKTPNVGNFRITIPPLG